MSKKDLFAMPDMFPVAVDIRDALEEIEALLAKHVVILPEERYVVALWVIHSYAAGLFQHTPRLLVSSPQMQCGKTSLLEILAALVCRPLHVSNLTAATLFRIIEQASPTLLADEADTYIYDNEDMRSVVNQGHTKAGSMVMRCHPTSLKVEFFDCYSPLVIGQIGLPPATILDRCIPIYMKRKKAAERVEPFISGSPTVQQQCEELQAKSLRWVNDNEQTLRATHPALPPMLQNRNADKWRPLFVIAELAGAPWPDRVLQAASHAIALSSDDDEPLGTQLLFDIRDMIQRVQTPIMETSEMLIGLNDADDRPWKSLRNGKSMDAKKLSDLLRPFGIRPKNHTFPNSVRKKGYTAADFKDAFDRYLPP
jgi:hypothetical protein